MSGQIETHGTRVEVYVYPAGAGAIDLQKTEGHFELRGEMTASQARALLLKVEPCCFAPFCDEEVELPPLRLSEGQWVNARTGKPVVVSIELREFDPLTNKPYIEQCPPR